jgi:uncharacterized protein
MKWIISTIIKCYWLIPQSKRRSCLFKESCSQYVFRMDASKGLAIGLSAFYRRYKKCRRGYTILTNQNGFQIKLVDGTYLREQNISSTILASLNGRINLHLKKISNE